MKPMDFDADVDGQPKPVRIVFGDERRLTEIRRWRSPKSLLHDPHISEALEYARLASKRWRYYHRHAETATSLATLRAAIRRQPRVEVAFMLLALGGWRVRQPILGLAYCRRTWCHHIIVDFVAVHPGVIGAVRGRVRGVGTGLFHGLVTLADELEVGTIWGEATANAAPFYEKILGAERILDHFFITGAAMERCRRGLARIHQSRT